MEPDKNQLKLVQEKGRYQLESSLSATLDEYLNMLDILTEKLSIRDVKYVNDYDNYYHIFDFHNVKVVASYSNFLGICIFIRDEANTDIQKDVLEKLNALL